MSAPNSPHVSPKKGKYILAKVLMLDDVEHMFQVPHKALGYVLFDEVCRKLQLLECDYFDLEFEDHQGIACWIDHEKPILKQVSINNLYFKFLVKFYTPDPGLLEDEYTRYLFAMQIRRDIYTNNMQCQEHTWLLLASYIVQAEIGDYLEDEYLDHTYLNDMHLIPGQTEEQTIKLMEHHKELVGLSPAEADFNLLDTARKVDMYGIHVHTAKDHEGVLLNLSVAHMGVQVFQSMTRINTFSWAKIRKLSFKRKKFLIKLHPEGYGYYKDTVEFYFDSRNECKNFWKKCIEHHAFFRCSAVKRVPRNKTRIVSRGSSFRYSGRTQKQLIEYVRANYTKRPPFERSASMRTVSMRNAGATPNTSTLNSRDFSHSHHSAGGHNTSTSSGSHILDTASRDKLSISDQHQQFHKDQHPPRKETSADDLDKKTGEHDDFNYSYYQISYDTAQLYEAKANQSCNDDDNVSHDSYHLSEDLAGGSCSEDDLIGGSNDKLDMYNGNSRSHSRDNVASGDVTNGYVCSKSVDGASRERVSVDEGVEHDAKSVKSIGNISKVSSKHSSKGDIADDNDNNLLARTYSIQSNDGCNTVEHVYSSSHNLIEQKSLEEKATRHVGYSSTTAVSERGQGNSSDEFSDNDDCKSESDVLEDEIKYVLHRRHVVSMGDLLEKSVKYRRHLSHSPTRIDNTPRPTREQEKAEFTKIKTTFSSLIHSDQKAPVGPKRALDYVVLNRLPPTDNFSYRDDSLSPSHDIHVPHIYVKNTASKKVEAHVPFSKINKPLQHLYPPKAEIEDLTTTDDGESDAITNLGSSSSETEEYKCLIPVEDDINRILSECHDSDISVSPSKIALHEIPYVDDSMDSDTSRNVTDSKYPYNMQQPPNILASDEFEKALESRLSEAGQTTDDFTDTQDESTNMDVIKPIIYPFIPKKPKFNAQKPSSPSLPSGSKPVGLDHLDASSESEVDEKESTVRFSESDSEADACRDEGLFDSNIEQSIEDVLKHETVEDNDTLKTAEKHIDSYNPGISVQCKDNELGDVICDISSEGSVEHGALEELCSSHFELLQRQSSHLSGQHMHHSIEIEESTSDESEGNHSISSDGDVECVVEDKLHEYQKILCAQQRSSLVTTLPQRHTIDIDEIDISEEDAEDEVIQVATAFTNATIAAAKVIAEQEHAAQRENASNNEPGTTLLTFDDGQGVSLISFRDPKDVVEISSEDEVENMVEEHTDAISILALQHRSSLGGVAQGSIEIDEASSDDDQKYLPPPPPPIAHVCASEGDQVHHWGEAILAAHPKSEFPQKDLLTFSDDSDDSFTGVDMTTYAVQDISSDSDDELGLGTMPLPSDFLHSNIITSSCTLSRVDEVDEEVDDSASEDLPPPPPPLPLTPCIEQPELEMSHMLSELDEACDSPLEMDVAPVDPDTYVDLSRTMENLAAIGGSVESAGAGSADSGDSESDFEDVSLLMSKPLPVEKDVPSANPICAKEGIKAETLCGEAQSSEELATQTTDNTRETASKEHATNPVTESSL